MYGGLRDPRSRPRYQEAWSRADSIDFVAEAGVRSKSEPLQMGIVS